MSTVLASDSEVRAGTRATVRVARPAAVPPAASSRWPARLARPGPPPPCDMFQPFMIATLAGLGRVATRAVVRLLCLDAVAGVQLPRHAGDHDPALEQQPGLEPQRGLVVQQLLPPVADHVFGDVDGDQV